jgi:hypothetical protein
MQKRWKRLFALILVALLVVWGGLSGVSWRRPANPASGDAHAAELEHHLVNLSPEELAKLPADGGPEYNRLVFEKSPYLLQHARNPVDWYPWGEAAFEKARREDKPIFLSVGYSTCHWCHVMERESFADPEVAAMMNEYFVPIKVDREERPDVDQIYMTVTQVMGQRGGWPNTIVLTPDRKPFFAGTYFPKEGRFGRPGMLDLLPGLHQAWTTRRADVLETAERVVAALQQSQSGTNAGIATGTSAPDLGRETLQRGYKRMASQYDAGYGGFGGAPKFPTPQNFLFLLRYWKLTDDSKALEMVADTLRKMRQGGIYDDVGFGFHRYSTDERWLVPHFEKMLYDQAMLAMAYSETWQATREPVFEETAREIFAYVLRDMTSPEGGFYSAEDADSEGEEGKFYLWTTNEVREILGKDDGDFFVRVFNLEDRGNFIDQIQGGRTGENIPHLGQPWVAIAAKEKMNTEQLRQRVEGCRKKLFSVREERIHPLKDDKILTDWNGLMIAALAKGARSLDEPEYAAAARKAADFVLADLRTADGRLLKRYRQGEASLPAHLEDYAFMVWGLLELYETTFEVRYLQEALALNRIMLDQFRDERNGGFYLTAADGEELLVRPKEVYDGAIPSGNSVAFLNLLRLGRITADDNLEVEASTMMRAFSREVARSPTAHNFFMTGLTFAVGPSLEIVIAGQPGQDDANRMLAALYDRYLPNKVVLFRPAGEENPPITALAEYTAAQTAIENQATAYVCRNYACKAPTTDVDEMIRSIDTAVSPPLDGGKPGILGLFGNAP